MSGIPVGPFDLETRIGRGGMGEVWLATHVDGGEDDPAVAVKVLTDRGARDPQYLQAFKNEVRLAAGLDHPHILLVHDYGEISPEAEKRSRGALKAGSPWLAMELADGGAVGATAQLSWRELRWVLLCVLDALAHAHARGVVHRDIKPENVLLSEGGIKVSDFGLAQTVEHLGEAELAHHHAGTPHYMAPEQIEGRWRDWGPWTDLYGLGCLAWTLASGAPPFAAQGLGGAIDAHLSAEPPSLEPNIGVPEGFEAWLRKLLSKDPFQRYRRAADATWALLSLPEPVEIDETSFDITAPLPSLDTLEITWEGEERSGAAAYEHEAPIEPDDTAPFPPTWRRPQGQEPPPRMAGVGLGLFGLRDIPLVGRHALRDELWGHLADVEKSRRPRLVVLRGEVGVGKTRVARWLCERGHALGAVSVLSATHAEASGADNGIGPMLARHLRVQDLDPDAAHERIAGMLRRLGEPDPDEAIALSELIAPAGRIKLSSPSERYVLVERHLERMARFRPVLLRLESVHWSIDALGLAAQLLWSQRELPCLVLATVRDEVLAERPVEASLLERLLEQERAASVTVSSLDVEDTSKLVRQLLGLRGELAEQIEERCAGNPMFAVQLVGDFVQRGVLVATPAGFRLRGGEDAELPDDLHRLWTERTERFLEARPDTDGQMLEIAAVMGVEVDTRQWRHVCRRAGLQVSLRLVDALIARRLARCGEEGPAYRWSFEHTLLHESLVKRARDGGRYERWNAAAAEVLAEAGGPDVQARLGRHLLRAGRPEEALAPLLAGAQERGDSGDVREALLLLEEREEVMRGMRLEAGDRRWGTGWAIHARTALYQADYDAADTWGHRLLDAALEHGWESLEIEALCLRSTILRYRGEREEAALSIERAIELARERNLADMEAACQRERAWLACEHGELELARQHVLEALLYYDGANEHASRARCLAQLGAIERQAGRYDDAYGHVDAARQIFQAHGSRRDVANALNSMGELSRLLERLDGAERLYLEALRLAEAAGDWSAVYPELNLALIHIARGQWAEARERQQRASATIESLERTGLQAIAEAIGLPIAAHFADWAAFRRHLAFAAEVAARSGHADVDAARSAGIGARLAAAAGRDREAREAWSLAVAHWQILGRQEEADEAREQMLRLG